MPEMDISFASSRPKFRRPRDLRFGPDSNLYCVALDEIESFDLQSGKCLGTAVRFRRLLGQAIELFP
jgi:hypothetical protein